jgi:glycine/D-amino acid oxidase-like deaminating enzyme
MAEKDSTFDVIVIGAGIVGCTSAFYLARQGLRVALVERGQIGAGTTSNSFAWINATSKVVDESYHRLNALGQATYRELAVEFGEQRIGLNPTGMLQWVRRTDPAGFQELSDKAEKLKQFGYPSTRIGHTELTAMEPHIKFDEDVEGLFAMADPCLDAPFFTQFLVGELRTMGASVYENCAANTLAMTDDGVITGVMTQRGLLSSTKVLITVGPSTPEVLSDLTGYDGFAARFPMTRVPGLLVTTPSTAPQRLVRHIIYIMGTDAIHILPAPNGGLKIGADDTDGLVADNPAPQRVREAALKLLRRTQALVPSFVGESCIDECQIGIGVRPYPQDGKTLAGPLPGAEGLYVIATHSGVTLSPALGKLMSELIVHGDTPKQLEPFSLTRFQAFM